MRFLPVFFILLLMIGSFVPFIPQESEGGEWDLGDVDPLKTQRPLDMTGFSRDEDKDLVDDLLVEQEGLDVVRGYIGINVHMSGPVERRDVVRVMDRADELGMDPVFIRTGRFTTVVYLIIRPEKDVSGLLIPGVEFLEYRPMMKPFLDVSSVAIRSKASTQYSPMTASDLDISGEGVTIAVLDSGVDNNLHESLRGKYQFGADFTGTTVVYGLDPDDIDGHGTHVAGTALGSGGNTGTYTGVAPDSDLVDLKIFKSFGSILGNADEAFEWLIENHEERDIQIAQCSFGSSVTTSGRDTTAQLANRLVEEGVVVVVAAGNDGIQGLPSPASADKVITVGAYNDRDTPSRDDDNIEGFSNRGPRASDGDLDSMDELKPDVGAPGRNIIAPGHNSVLSYVTLTGTSMSCPHVSGVVALMLQANPELSPAQIKSIIRDTSQQKYSPSRQDLDDKYNYRSGWGEVDAYGAVKRALDLDQIELLTPTEVASGSPVDVEVKGTFTKTPYDTRGDVIQLELLTPYSWGRPENLILESGAYDTVTTIEGPRRSGENWLTTGTILYNSSVEEVEPYLRATMIPRGETGASGIILGSYSINDMTFSSVSRTVNITEGPTPPDLSITPLAIWFSESIPEGGDQIEITARINNTGGRSVEGALVRFLDGPQRSGDIIGERTIDVPSMSYALATVAWEANPGIHAITVVVDPENEVTETQENNNSAERPITVRGINPPPIAQLEVTPSTGSTITRFVFDGSGSQDTNLRGGNVVSYRFDFGDGSNSGWVNSDIVEHRYQSGGSYTASLTVRDNGGEESSNQEEVIVNVTDVTSLKKVLYLNSSMGLSEDAGEDSNMTIDDSFSDIGTWTSGPMSRSVRLHSLFSIYMVLSSSGPGTFEYSIELSLPGEEDNTVSGSETLDGGTQMFQVDMPIQETTLTFGETFSLSLFGSIEGAPQAYFELGDSGSFIEYLYYTQSNQPPEVNAGEDIEVRARTPVTFNGEAQDEDGEIVLLRWDIDDDGSFEEEGEDSYSYTYPGYESEGLYNVRFEAIDNDGGSSSDVLSVTVRPEDYNFPPEVSIECEPGTTVSGSAKFTGTAEDDGPIESVQVRFRSVLTGDLVLQWRDAEGTEEWSAEIDTRPFADGDYDLEARSFDGSLYSEIAACRYLVVNQNSPPGFISSEMVPDEIVSGQDLTIIITSTISDPDGMGDIISVKADMSSLGDQGLLEMTDDGEGDDGVAGDGTFTGSFEPPLDISPGTYDIVIIAEDTRGNTASNVLYLNIQADIYVRIVIQPRNPRSGDAVTIEVEVDSPSPVVVTAASSIFEEAQTVELLDNGAQGDIIAGDGIFSAVSVVKAPPGEYVISIRVVDESGLQLYSGDEEVSLSGGTEEIGSIEGGAVGPLEIALAAGVVLVIIFTAVLVILFRKKETTGKNISSYPERYVVETVEPIEVLEVETLEDEVLSGQFPIKGEMPEISDQAHQDYE